MFSVAAKVRPYCPDEHITARQLRGLGFYLSEMIPDEAFVRRVAVGLNDDEELDDGSSTLGLRVDEPFAVASELELAAVA